jgi:predicted amidohydrolase
VKVAAVQHDIVWEDREATLARLAPRVAAAAGEGARLVVLAEMFAVGFSMRTDVVAEERDGPTSSWLREQAASHGAWVCGSVPERAPGAALPSNVFVLAAPDGSVHRYAKRKPFGFGGETDHYAAGDASLTVDVEGVRITPFVCYDLRFADLFWERAAGTDLYVVVASWPSPRRHHWRTLLAARAIENQAYVVGVNRVGDGGGLSYGGDSCAVDPMGEVTMATPDVEDLLVADVDPEVVAATRARFPFLADR